MELRREHADLAEERDGIETMLASEKMQWKLVGEGLRHVREVLGPQTEVGRRRSTFAEAPTIDASASVEALVAREPITVILSERGWIRAARGRIEDPSELKFKEGDSLAFLVAAETTDKLLLFASDGRFFTLAGDKLPSARGQGEPLRLMLDLDDRVGILAIFVHRAGERRVLASKPGYGFVLPVDEALAMRRAGKQVLNTDDAGAAFCLAADGDHLAVIGDNGKALIFSLGELPQTRAARASSCRATGKGACA